MQRALCLATSLFCRQFLVVRPGLLCLLRRIRLDIESRTCRDVRLEPELLVLDDFLFSLAAFSASASSRVFFSFISNPCSGSTEKILWTRAVTFLLNSGTGNEGRFQAPSAEVRNIAWSLAAPNR